jgi:hypothetical protein
VAPPIELEGREVVVDGTAVGLNVLGGATLTLGMVLPGMVLPGMVLPGMVLPGMVLGQGAIALVGGNIGAVVAARGGFHGLAGAGG